MNRDADHLMQIEEDASRNNFLEEVTTGVAVSGDKSSQFVRHSRDNSGKGVIIMNAKCIIQSVNQAGLCLLIAYFAPTCRVSVWPLCNAEHV